MSPVEAGGRVVLALTPCASLRQVVASDHPGMANHDTHHGVVALQDALLVQPLDTLIPLASSRPRCVIRNGFCMVGRLVSVLSAPIHTDYLWEQWWKGGVSILCLKPQILPCFPSG
jgi:hypothetical protein